MKYTKRATNYTKDQMAMKCSSIFNCKTLQNLPRLGFLVLKYAIWQPCGRVQPCNYFVVSDLLKCSFWWVIWTLAPN
jgi:hypothetical protein